MNTLLLNEYRCKCGKLLMKGVFFDGTVEIKCKSCGTINNIGQIKLKKDGKQYLLIINEKGVIINASDSACKILGYEIKELIGKICNQIDPSVTLDTKEKIFGEKSTLNEENYFQFDTIHQSKSGKQIPVKAILRLCTGERNKCVLLSARVKDIKFDTKLPARNGPEYVNEACDFYFEIDKDGIGTYLSPSMDKLFGLSQEKALGKSYFDALPLEQQEEAKKDFRFFSERQQPYRRVSKKGVLINNKAPFFYDAYFTPNFNDNGNFIGYRVSGWLNKLLVISAYFLYNTVI